MLFVSRRGEFGDVARGVLMRACWRCGQFARDEEIVCPFCSAPAGSRPASAAVALGLLLAGCAPLAPEAPAAVPPVAAPGHPAAPPATPAPDAIKPDLLMVAAYGVAPVDLAAVRDPVVAYGEVVLSEPDVDAAGIVSVVQKRRGTFENCLKSTLKRDPAISSSIRAEWQIDEGRITHLGVLENTTGDPGLATCFLNVVRGIRYPEDVNVTVQSFTWTVKGK